jgi:hypothetical protein
LLFAIGLELAKARSTRHGPAAASIMAIAGLGAPLAFAEIGSTMGDLTLSVPTLAGVLVALRSVAHPERRLATRGLVVAGLLFGVAAGLKYTFGLACLAAAGALLAGPPRGLSRAAALAWLAAGGVPGFLVTAGPWMACLHTRFGSPLFPFFNGLFRSPFGGPASFRDGRWAFQSAFEALVWPFTQLGSQAGMSEVPIRSWYLPMAWASLAFLILWGLRRALAGGPRTEDLAGGERWLLGFFVTGYAAWAIQFAYYRYLLPFELLAPMVVMVALGRGIGRDGVRLGAIALVAVLMLGLSTKRFRGLFAGWRVASYFEVQLPPRSPEVGSMVLLAGGAPTSYLVPFLPAGIRAVRVGGNLQEVEGPGLGQWRERLVAAHSGPFWILSSAGEMGAGRAALRALGLEVDGESCGPVASAASHPTVLCRASRAGTPSGSR